MGGRGGSESPAPRQPLQQEHTLVSCRRLRPEARSGGTRLGGGACYKAGKHGGGRLRRKRRRRGKRLVRGHGGGGSRPVNRAALPTAAGCAALRVALGAAGRPRSPGLNNSAEEREARGGGGRELGPVLGPCERRRCGPAAARGGTEVPELCACGRPPFPDSVPGPIGRGPRPAR